MAENTPNKGAIKSLKVTPELHRELKTFASSRGEKLEPVVEKALRGYMLMRGETPSTDTRKIALTSVHDGGVLYGSPGNSELLSTITPQEIPLVEQFICLLRSTIPGLSPAITANVQTFTAYRLLRERGDNPNQSTAPGGTTAGASATDDALRTLERNAADAARTASEAARADADIASELADLARDGRSKRPEEAGDTGRTRKRRGA